MFKRFGCKDQRCWMKCDLNKLFAQVLRLHFSTKLDWNNKERKKEPSKTLREYWQNALVLSHPRASDLFEDPGRLRKIFKSQTFNTDSRLKHGSSHCLQSEYWVSPTLESTGLLPQLQLQSDLTEFCDINTAPWDTKSVAVLWIFSIFPQQYVKSISISKTDKLWNILPFGRLIPNSFT